MISKTKVIFIIKWRFKVYLRVYLMNGINFVEKTIEILNYLNYI